MEISLKYFNFYEYETLKNNLIIISMLYQCGIYSMVV